MTTPSDQEKEHKREPDYIRILSHQLKSPISSIQSLLNTISEGFTGEIPPKTRYFIEKAVNKAAEAKEIIADLLDYEAYSHKQQGFHEEVELVELSQILVNKYASRAAEKDIFLRANLPLEHQIYVVGERRGLEHALRNIIENAIKYTPEYGSVTIMLAIADTEQICQLQITDTGYGIPEAEHTQIFEPFFRSAKHKATMSGTGLGLPIAKRVITQHHGTISIHSIENQGTTFTITLPYHRLHKNEEKPTVRKRVVIIGGVTAGPKAAARLRRLDPTLDITIVEKGKFLSYAGCGLPSYIGDKVHSLKSLMATADNTVRDVDFFDSIEDIAVLNTTLAEQIDRERKIVSVRNLKNQTVLDIPYDILILATGAEFSVPPIPGIRQKGIYSLHTLEEAEAIKQEFARKRAQDVFIIGGGLIGISMAEALIQPGARVTILEKRPYILSQLIDRDIACKIQHEFQKKGIKILPGVKIMEIFKEHDRFSILTNAHSYYADLIVLATGVKPNTTLAQQAGLQIGRSGGIWVTPSLQTSDEAIYAVGDCAESVNLITNQPGYWPLGSVSTKMGRIAADNICGRKTEFRGSIGTVMFKVVDMNMARTGLTLRYARKHGFEAESVVVAGLDRAPYCENAEYVILKVIADRRTKILLGAQGYGKGDVVSKIQILACAMGHALTLDDVFKQDLGYAPSFNTPIDIVQTACLVLSNKIENLLRTITLEEFEEEKDQIQGIVDVSPFSEHTLRSIPGSLNVPLENLRLEGIPFDKDANVVLFSKTSSGAYKAYRYLISQGYTQLRVLEGGYVYWTR